MKTFLANALALSTILCWSKNFTSNSTVRLLMAIPVNHGRSSEKNTHKEAESYSITATVALVTARFELRIFKVNASATTGHLAKSIKVAPRDRGWDRR